MTSSDTPIVHSQFVYLLNAFEQAAQAENPFEAGYPKARMDLLEYVQKLEFARSEIGPIERNAIIEECAKVVEECRLLVDDSLPPVEMAKDMAFHLAIQVRALKESAAPQPAQKRAGEGLQPYPLEIGPKERWRKLRDAGVKPRPRIGTLMTEEESAAPQGEVKDSEAARGSTPRHFAPAVAAPDDKPVPVLSRVERCYLTGHGWNVDLLVIEARQLERELAGLGKDYGNLLAESNKHERAASTATSAIEARDSVLEEAAIVCEEWPSSPLTVQKVTCLELATAIRRLKSARPDSGGDHG